MPRKKKEKLVHFDIDSLSKKSEKKTGAAPESLGQILQFKREKKKLSLQDVSDKLCIKAIYLQALENGHYYAFPSRVYGVGFLRSYARFLGLDADALVAQFNQETADIKEEPMDMLVIDKQLRLPSRKTLWIVFILICLGIMLWSVASEVLSPDVFSKVAVPELQQANMSDDAVVNMSQAVPAIADEMGAVEAGTVKEEVAALDKKETKPAVVQGQDSATVENAPVAFVATREVWVELTNTETGKKILAKAMAQNEHYIPSVALSVLVLSTGRSGLALYQNGKKIKSFGAEKHLALAGLASQD
ncbi:MAG: helix-turn-helix domain-containing protein [Alphaproteobacteria bacterium]|nr:helix-turn-helix domain-containing protein [Alphaproteobacteria bacterium]